MALFGWLRGPRTARPCFATSPKGYWCTRTDRHADHQATGGSGRVYSSWRGDFPSEDELLETFTNEDGFRKAITHAARDDLTAPEHNDLLRSLL